MVSICIWLSIYTNNEILRIIRKFDLSSREVLLRINALNVEVLSPGEVPLPTRTNTRGNLDLILLSNLCAHHHLILIQKRCYKFARHLI